MEEANRPQSYESFIEFFLEITEKNDLSEVDPSEYETSMSIIKSNNLMKTPHWEKRIKKDLSESWIKKQNEKVSEAGDDSEGEEESENGEGSESDNEESEKSVEINEVEMNEELKAFMDEEKIEVEQVPIGGWPPEMEIFDAAKINNAIHSTMSALDTMEGIAIDIRNLLMIGLPVITGMLIYIIFK